MHPGDDGSMANRAGRTPKTNGQGLDTPRARTVARPGERAAKARGNRSVAETGPVEPGDASLRHLPRPIHGLRLTQRALAVIVVVGILLLSYASSVSVYLNQLRQSSEARQQIAQRTESIANLEDEIRRWQDPAYVKAQARERLGWVIPGEIGFRVVDANGKPIGGGSQIDRAGALPDGEHAETWYERVWGSVRTADNPEPVPADPKVIRPSAAPSSARPR